MPARSLNLKTYYSNFKYARVIGTALAAAVPFVPKILGDNWTEYLLAPLGRLDTFARVSLVVLCAAMTYLAYFFQEQSRSQRKILLSATVIVIPFIFVCLYMAGAYFFVREIYIPTRNRTVYVSVGFVRTDLAAREFGSMTDEQMLITGGFEEEQIRNLWTPTSLTLARLALFVSWSVIALSFVFGFSLGLLNEIEESVAKSEDAQRRRLDE